MASLLHLADFPASSLGALLPGMIPKCQKHRPVCEGVTRVGHAGEGQPCRAAQRAYLSLLPLKAKFFRLLHQLVCKASTHPLTESSLQLQRGRGWCLPGTSFTPREMVRPAMPRPAKEPSQLLGLEAAELASAAALLSTHRPCSCIHKARMASSSEAQVGVCTPLEVLLMVLLLRAPPLCTTVWWVGEGRPWGGQGCLRNQG